MFSLPYAYFAVAFCFCVFSVFAFVILFLVYLFICVLSLMCPFLPTMFFAGYFLVVRVLLSAFPVYFFSPNEHIRDLIWFGSVYLVVTAKFVADQLIM